MEQNELIKTARITGAWYFGLAISGMLGFLVFHPKLFVTNDPGKTLSNLTELVTIARIRLVFELLIVVTQALAAVWFYKLFCTVDKWAALALGIWGTVNAVIISVSAIAISASIGIANAAVPVMQDKVILIQLLSSIISNAWTVGGIFFGLWLLPMGYLVIRSGRMPIWLGRILLMGGVGYLLQTFLGSLGIGGSILDILVLPATVGEFWMIGYLLIFGIRPAVT